MAQEPYNPEPHTLWMVLAALAVILGWRPKREEFHPQSPCGPHNPKT